MTKLSKQHKADLVETLHAVYGDGVSANEIEQELDRHELEHPGSLARIYSEVMTGDLAPSS
jgi:hypothetical protein